MTIYIVGDQKDIRGVLDTKSTSIRGLYIPRAGGSVAFAEEITNSRGELSESMIILLHEYAHHFLMSSSPYALPRWFNEGAAEFFASAKFEKDGGVSVGRPALHRGNELFYAVDVTAEELLDPDLYEKQRSKRYDFFYGRSLLLYHYLVLSGKRQGQMTAYLQGLLDGKTSIEAARAAFGDLAELDKELDRYLKSRSWTYFPMTAEQVPIGPVSLRQLPEGEAAMMDVVMRSKRGVDEERAAEILVDARKVAARYPEDAGVLTALAEAEFDAGNIDAAIAAADRAIAIDPNRTNAYVQEGYAMFRKAEDADDSDAAYSAAMAPFSALNQIDNDHPLPLLYYYLSFVERGAAPSENAKHALERASQLAPFDHSLAMNAGLMQAGEGKIGLARRTLGPVAANPHSGSFAETAAGYRDQLAQAEEGTPWYPSGRGEIIEVEVEAAE